MKEKATKILKSLKEQDIENNKGDISLKKKVIENFAKKLMLLNEKDKKKIEYLKGYLDAKIDED